MEPKDCYRSTVIESKDEYECKPGVKIPYVLLTPKKFYEETGAFPDGGEEFGDVCALVSEDLSDVIEGGIFTPISCRFDYENCKANGAPTIVELPEKAMSKKELEDYLDKKGFQHNPKLDEATKQFVDYQA